MFINLKPIRDRRVLRRHNCGPKKGRSLLGYTNKLQVWNPSLAASRAGLFQDAVPTWSRDCYAHLRAGAAEATRGRGFGKGKSGNGDSSNQGPPLLPTRLSPSHPHEKRKEQEWSNVSLKLGREGTRELLGKSLAGFLQGHMELVTLSQGGCWPAGSWGFGAKSVCCM